VIFAISGKKTDRFQSKLPPNSRPYWRVAGSAQRYVRTRRKLT
jgi:hypothetical protein